MGIICEKENKDLKKVDYFCSKYNKIKKNEEENVSKIIGTYATMVFIMLKKFKRRKIT